MANSLSLCLITKNEEANLRNCLAPLTDLVTEIIVVDTGSTDATKEVARSFGARVFDFRWRDDFSAARNESLRHARGEWIFWLDADDTLDHRNRLRFKTLIARLKDENAAYFMKYRCPTADPTVTYVLDQVRLFRNQPQHRWKYRVHEQILPALTKQGVEFRRSDVEIKQTGYLDPVVVHRKTERNLRLMELDFVDNPDDAFVLFNMGLCHWKRGRRQEALRLWRHSVKLSQAAAERILRDALIVERAQADCGTKLAGLLLRLGQLRQAAAAFRSGRIRCLEDPELHWLQDAVLDQVGELTDGTRAGKKSRRSARGPRRRISISIKRVERR